MLDELVVDFLASESHFVDHTWPVYEALPPAMRGIFLTRLRNLTPRPMERSKDAGVGTFMLTASYGDIRRGRFAQRPTIFMEHGAGFHFRHSSYSGNPDRPGVCLFLCPNEYVLKANAETHPFTAASVIGCPKMDRWINAPQKIREDVPTVGFAFHWDCKLSPGTRSALDHYRTRLGDLKKTGWKLIGHSHPRAAHDVSLLCDELGIEWVPTLDEVFARADLLVADATSALYEFASIDRPVVVLNAPWYHEQPDEGIRFWKHIPGVEVEHPDELVPAVEWALDDPAEWREKRHAAVEAVYPVRGNAAETAVNAIKEFIRSCK